MIDTKILQSPWGEHCHVYSPCFLVRYGVIIIGRSPPEPGTFQELKVLFPVPDRTPSWISYMYQCVIEVSASGESHLV